MSGTAGLSPHPSSVLRGPGPCRSWFIWGDVAFATQLGMFPCGRENQEVILFS